MAYDGKPPRNQRLTFERRVLGMALLAGLPAALVAMVLLWVGGYSAKVNWTLGIFVVGWWLAVTFSLRERIIRPLQTLSNMLAALREGDYSIRARGGGGGAGQEDSLGLALFEINVLGETLRSNRLGAMEATALLRSVMAEIDVAVFTFDSDHRLVLANRFGERLLGQAAAQLLGRSAETLGLDACLTGDVHRSVEMTFPGAVAVGAGGRWEMRRRSFRQQGMPHQLLVLADVSRALREEERQAWQRLVRVLSHEINNSLAPIWSIAGSLQSLLRRDPRPPDWDEDFLKGLSVITTRSESLNRFMSSYALLARLPKPRLQAMDVQEWVSRVAQLETRLPVAVVPGAPARIDADSDQLDQLLINLVRNAADASLETGGGVSVGWKRNGSRLEIWVRDDGHGLGDTANLFVPFFTTKPHGSGIGLALSRQIAEAHGGSLTLENRSDGKGCEAKLRLTV